MKKIAAAFLGNFLGITAAWWLLADFMIDLRWAVLLPAALFLIIAGLILRPLVKIIFWPLTFISFGLLYPAVVFLADLLSLKILDWISPALSINDGLTLIAATLIITSVNLLFQLLWPKYLLSDKSLFP